MLLVYKKAVTTIWGIPSLSLIASSVEAVAILCGSIWETLVNGQSLPVDELQVDCSSCFLPFTCSLSSSNEVAAQVESSGSSVPPERPGARDTQLTYFPIPIRNK